MFKGFDTAQTQVLATVGPLKRALIEFVYPKMVDATAAWAAKAQKHIPEPPPAPAVPPTGKAKICAELKELFKTKPFQCRTENALKLCSVLLQVPIADIRPSHMSDEEEEDDCSEWSETAYSIGIKRWTAVYSKEHDTLLICGLNYNNYDMDEAFTAMYKMTAEGELEEDDAYHFGPKNYSPATPEFIFNRLIAATSDQCQVLANMMNEEENDAALASGKSPAKGRKKPRH